MSRKLRIAQVTDCHVSAAPGTLYRGHDPVTNLQAVLKHVSTMEPDILLATGDLSEDGSAGSYATLRKMLERTGLPVLALPGNHDDPALLSEYFPGSPVGGLLVTDHGEWQIIRLDSCLPGKPHGRLDEETLQALEETLAEATGRPRLVALHHQPLLANSPWIDKYRLMDAAPFLELVERSADIKVVVWGHIHQPFETKLNGTLMMGGPSSVSNSLPVEASFTPDNRGAAYRWLELEPDGSLETSVVFVGRELN
jgi:Icc protein